MPRSRASDHAEIDLPEAELGMRRLAALAELEFAGQDAPEEILSKITELATELLPTSIGSSVIVLDSGSREFQLAATTVPGQAGLEMGDADGSATLHVVESQQRVVVPDTKDDPFDAGRLAGDSVVRAYVAVPIVAEGRSLGVLYALDDTPRRYRQADLEYLELLALRSAAAVLHAQLFWEVRAARERSEALAWGANAMIAAEDLSEVLSSVVEGVSAAVIADSAHIVTLESGRVVESAVSAGTTERPSSSDLMDGLMGTAVRELRLVITPNVADPEAPPAVVAPLRKGEQVLGALSVTRKPGEQRFDEAEVDLVFAMASQAAVAIDNVRLLEQTRSALRETEAMYSISQALIAGADLPDMLVAVAKGAREALQAAGVLIFTLDLGQVEVIGKAAWGRVPNGDREDPLAGHLGEVVSSDQPVRQDGGETSLIAVPLRVHQRLLGAIAAYQPIESGFTDHQFDTLLTLGAQAAVAFENQLLFDEVQRLAITDELTGVHSRRHLFELGEHEFAQAVRYRKPLAAIMLDLDFFKGVNDTLGHQVGDEVLRGVAERCRSVLREVDILGRYGGEEFVVILPEADVESAGTVAERVRTAVGDEPIETSRGPVVVTISAGVAYLQSGVLDLKTLLDQADAALYEAKGGGRDQVATVA